MWKILIFSNFIEDKLSTHSLAISLEYRDNISDIIINKHQIYCLEKLNNRELYNMQLIVNVEKAASQTYFEKKVQALNWNRKIYICLALTCND